MILSKAGALFCIVTEFSGPTGGQIRLDGFSCRKKIFLLIHCLLQPNVL